MHLYQLRLVDYRRFADATINLDSRMVAILGPNESGKSSLLDALALFNDQNRVASAHLRRDSDHDDYRMVGELTFRLEEAERDEIPYQIVDSAALWLKVTKLVGGTLRYSLLPSPSRPQEARSQAAALIRRALESPWYRKLEALKGADQESEERQFSPALADIAEELSSDAEQLSVEAVGAIEATTGLLLDIDVGQTSKAGAKAIRKLADALADVVHVERFPTPDELAGRIATRRPRCVSFDEAHRTLGFSHSLSNVAAVSPAFRNLADFGDLDLEALQAAVQSDDSGAKRTILGDATDEINRRLHQDWGQSDLKVDFDLVSVEDLRITVAGADGKQFDLTYRSDGMRMFLSLCAFLAKEGQEPKPILLIDELERHLHYEAQADIVSMFDRRADVAQVIYSTHSIGCLPQDLGRGVRVVVPDTAAGTSSINNLWLREQPGVRPLMAAMGAATLPLQPSRPLVFGEGPSDAILLPSLLREAIGEQPLDYLVVSGASVVSRANLEEFDRAASRVVYLYDGDKAGAERKRFLAKRGIPTDRIIQLERPVTLEDLIEPTLWLEAANRAISEIAAGDYPVNSLIGLRDIPATGRIGSLRTWCTREGYRTPEKLRLAETILELMTGPAPRTDRRWLDPRRRPGLRAVHEAIASRT